MFLWIGGFVSRKIVSKTDRFQLINWLVKDIPLTHLSYVFMPAIFAMGGLVYSLHTPSSVHSIYSYNNSGNFLTITGKVVDPPDVREKLTLIKVKTTSFATEAGLSMKSGEILQLFLPMNNNIQYGDVITMSGKPTTPAENEDFSYKDYLAGQQIFSVFYYPMILDVKAGSPFDPLKYIFEFKQKSIYLLEKVYPMPESSLVKGILLGADNDIPEDLYTAFRNSGTTHLIAISGFNVSIVASLVILLFGKLLGKWRGTIFSIVIIVLYTILVGASPSVVRAAIMGSLGMLGLLIGRRSGGINSVYLTACLMLLYNPFLLWNISFQLSVAATLGLVLYASFLDDKTISFFSRYFPENSAMRWSRICSEYLLYTLAAQIPAFPLLLYHFHNLPLTTFVSNPLALPLQPPLMILSALTLLISWISISLGKIVSIISLPFITATIRIVEWAGALEWSKINTMQVPLLGAAIWIMLLSIPAALPRLFDPIGKLWKPLFGLVALFFLSSFLIHSAIDQPDGKLTIAIMGGSQPGGMYIQTPSGNRILINGGDRTNRLLSFLDPYLPVLIRNLDAVVVTEAKNKQDSLPEVLKLIPADQVYVFNYMDTNDTLSSLAEFEPKFEIPGDSLSLGDGVRLRFRSVRSDGAQLDLEYQHLVVRWITGPMEAKDLCRVNVVILEEMVLDPLDDVLCNPQIIVSQQLAGSNSISLNDLKGLILRSDGKQVWMEKY